MAGIDGRDIFGPISSSHYLGLQASGAHANTDTRYIRYSTEPFAFRVIPETAATSLSFFQVLAAIEAARICDAVEKNYSWVYGSVLMYEKAFVLYICVLLYVHRNSARNTCACVDVSASCVLARARARGCVCVCVYVPRSECLCVSECEDSDFPWLVQCDAQRYLHRIAGVVLRHA